MLLTALTIRRFVIVGLMLVALVVLADGIARTELTRAVNASQHGARLIVYVAGAAD